MYLPYPYPTTSLDFLYHETHCHVRIQLSTLCPELYLSLCPVSYPVLYPVPYTHHCIQSLFTTPLSVSYPDPYGVRKIQAQTRLKVCSCIAFTLLYCSVVHIGGIDCGKTERIPWYSMSLFCNMADIWASSICLHLCLHYRIMGSNMSSHALLCFHVVPVLLCSHGHLLLLHPRCEHQRCEQGGWCEYYSWCKYQPWCGWGVDSLDPNSFCL